MSALKSRCRLATSPGYPDGRVELRWTRSHATHARVDALGRMNASIPEAGQELNPWGDPPMESDQ